VNLLLKIKKRLSNLLTKDSQQRWEEEYLSQAKDLYDLERRQKRLERGEVANMQLWHINTQHNRGQNYVK
jgi:predicted RNA-binding protein with EMAP domain